MHWPRQNVTQGIQNMHDAPLDVAVGAPMLPPSDASKALYSDSMLGPVLP